MILRCPGSWERYHNAMKDAPTTIAALDPNRFRVEVAGAPPSAHEVIVSDEAHARLAAGRMSKEALLRASFAFLLAREPNTAILARFEIEVIGRYFPEYAAAMRKAAATAK